MLFFVIKLSIIIFTVLTLCIFFALTILYKVSFNYWKKRKVCTWEPRIPCGNAKDVFLQKKQHGFDTVEFYKYIKSKSLKYGGYYFFTTPVFIPVDINLIKKMFINDFEYFSDRIAHVDESNDPLSANVVHLARDRWKVIRPTLMSFLSSKNINETFPLLKECAFTLVGLIEDFTKKENTIELEDFVDGFAVDLISAFFLKINSDAMVNPNSAFKTNIKNVFEKSFKHTLVRLLVLLPSVTKFCKVQTYTANATEFFKNLISSILKSRKQEQMQKNILDDLLSNKIPLTKSEILGNVAVLYLAGYDTSSSTITFCLYELALNQELQDAVRREIATVLASYAGEYTYSSVEECSLLGACVKETLRKYPMCTVVSRICTRNYPVPDSDIVLNKGTHVYMPIRAVHWDDEFYPNPGVFDPERFTEKKSVNRPPCTWIPYGAGPRRCVGYKLANISVKLCLAVLLQRCKFDLDPSSSGPMEYNPKSYLLQAKKPIRFVLTKVQI